MGGVGSGAKPKVYPEEMVSRVRELYESGMTQDEVAAEIGVSKKVIYNLMRRHGVPRRPQAKRNQRGPQNTTWKGDQASYKALHQRLYHRNVSRCDECGTTDPAKSYDWANLTGNYGDENDYRRMCRSCHRRFDNARRRGVMPDA